jgi:hypothetical protein
MGDKVEMGYVDVNDDSVVLQTMTIVRDPKTRARSVELIISLDVGDTDYEHVMSNTTSCLEWQQLRSVEHGLGEGRYALGAFRHRNLWWRLHKRPRLRVETTCPY